jgi:hypothetical protein
MSLVVMALMEKMTENKLNVSDLRQLHQSAIFCRIRTTVISGS